MYASLNTRASFVQNRPRLFPTLARAMPRHVESLHQALPTTIPSQSSRSVNPHFKSSATSPGRTGHFNNSCFAADELAEDQKADDSEEGSENSTSCHSSKQHAENRTDTAADEQLRQEHPISHARATGFGKFGKQDAKIMFLRPTAPTSPGIYPHDFRSLHLSQHSERIVSGRYYEPQHPPTSTSTGTGSGRFYEPTFVHFAQFSVDPSLQDDDVEDHISRADVSGYRLEEARLEDGGELSTQIITSSSRFPRGMGSEEACEEELTDYHENLQK